MVYHGIYCVPVPWYSTVVYYRGTVPWYTTVYIVFQYHGTVPWYTTVVQYNGIPRYYCGPVPWYNLQIYYIIKALSTQYSS